MAGGRDELAGTGGVAVNPDWDDGVLEALYEAAFSDPGAVIIGVLVGQRSLSSIVPRIAAMIPASTARYPQVARLDHEEWAYIHSTMARYYGGLEIVGWWVSRPGPDTELGDFDLAGAAEQFARPNQFGFVFDSRHRAAALYGWHQGRYVRLHEGPVPRQFTRSRPTGSPWPQAVTAVGFGMAIGVLAWAVSGQPGLPLASLAPIW